MRSPVTRTKFLILAAAAPALLLAYAPFPLRFFAFIALVPLLWTIERATPGKAFLWGWLGGGLIALFHFFWLWFLVVPVGTTTRILLNLGVVLLFAYLGLYTAVFATLVRRLGLWSAPLIWPLMEYLKSRAQIAFPWDLLGYTMTPWTPFIQPAALGGVYLVSAWLVLVNLLLYCALFPRDSAPRSALGISRSSFRPALALAVALLVPLAAGLIRAKPLPRWFDVAIIQPDVSALDKGDWESRERIQSDLIRMTREAAASHPDLILYPETATVADVTHSNAIGPAIQHLVDSLGIEVFTGSPLRDETTNAWHNGAVLMRPGEYPPRQRYYKIRLVPFSEKIPYADEVPLIAKLVGTDDMGNWGRGHDLTVFDWAKGKLSCLICFEAIFPDYARQFTARGAELFVVVTNDGWFGRILGAQQLAELSVMRSVENGVPLVRSANNGISCIVDAYGRVLRQTRLDVQTILYGTVPRPLPPTPYRRWGDWFIGACAIATLAAVVIKTAGGIAARRKNRRPAA